MANLLAEKQNVPYWGQYRVLNVAGPGAGLGLNALPPVRAAIGNGVDTRTITLSCGKLTTGVTVAQWGFDPHAPQPQVAGDLLSGCLPRSIAVVGQKPARRRPVARGGRQAGVLVFDFAPTRALQQLSDYGIGLSPEEPNPEKAVEELVSFLPVLAYDGANMTQVDAAGILDIAMAWNLGDAPGSQMGVRDSRQRRHGTLKKIMSNESAMAAVMNIEGFRALAPRSSRLWSTSRVGKEHEEEEGSGPNAQAKKELSDEEKEYKSKRKQIQEKLIKFATRIPAFMYLTDYRENTLKDVITKLEPSLFRSVTGLTVEISTYSFPRRIQCGAHEPGRVRFSAVRGCVPRLHRHRVPRRA